MIEKQMMYMCAMFGTGIIIMLIYDIVLLLRLIVKRSLLWQAAGDLIFWSGAGIFTFFVIYKYNDGSIRAYAVLFLLIGACLEKWAIHDRFKIRAAHMIKKYKKNLKLLYSSCRIRLLRSKGAP